MAVKRTARAATAGKSKRPSHIRPVSKGGYLRWMNYGMPGAGKSKLTGTGTKPALILASNEDETVSITSGDVSVWHCPTVVELTEAYEYLRHGGHNDFGFAWVDNATLMQDQNMDYIMANLVAAKPHRSVYKSDMAEYGENQNMIGLFVRNFVTLPMHVGITAHVMEKDDLNGKPTYLPLFQGGQGAFSQKLCGYMNVVTYMDVVQKDGTNTRRLHFEKSGKIYAKDRFGVFGKRMVDPTITKMEAMLAKRNTTK